MRLSTMVIFTKQLCVNNMDLRMKSVRKYVILKKVVIINPKASRVQPKQFVIITISVPIRKKIV